MARPGARPRRARAARAVAQLGLSQLAARRAATGVAVALVTHDLRHALLLADRIAVLLDGRLAQIGPRDTVLRRPASADVARLVGMANLVPGQIVGREPEGIAVVEVAPAHRLRAAARAELAAGARVLVGIRPEHLEVDVGRGDAGLIGKGAVLRTIDDGTLVTAWIEWGGHALRTVAIAGRGLGHELEAGQTVSLALRPEDAHLLPP